VHLGLSLVDGAVPLGIPPEVLRAVDAAVASRRAHVELWAERHRSVVAHWFRYRRVAAVRRERAGAVGFARWVSHNYDVAGAAAFVRRKVTRAA
jgi:hypothetical protein